jgi:hypothetical protein
VLNRAAVLGLVLVLSACGSGAAQEDFAVTKPEPVAAAFAALGAGALPPELRSLFPGLKVVRSRPDGRAVLYTIPASSGAESTILLTFESANDGGSTIVHAAVQVPAIRAQIDGQAKVISEAKIERDLRGLITDKSGEAARQALSGLLAAVAIATDAKAVAEAQRLMKDPRSRAAALEALGDDLYESDDPEADADSVDRVEGRTPQPASDPDAALERADDAAREAEWREERRLRAAGAAGDEASGDEPEPEFTPDE